MFKPNKPAASGVGQATVIAASLLYGAVILVADILGPAGEGIAIAYIGMALPSLWLTWTAGPVLCAIIGVLFVAVGGYLGYNGADPASVVLAARGGTALALLAGGLLVSGRIRTEAALHEALSRFGDVLDVSTDWIWETDADHRFRFVSDRCFELTGLTADQVIGKRRTDLLMADPTNGEVASHMAGLIARRPFSGFKYWFDAPYGRCCFAISGKPLFDEKGQFTGYRGSGRDVTETGLMERQLIEATSEAEAASRAKSDFLSAMSHELRTPLNAIIGFSEVLSDEMFGPIGQPKYREYAEDIQSSGRHLLDMIDDILDINRIETGRMDLAEEPVDPVLAIQQAVEMVAVSAERGGVALNSAAPANLPAFFGDRRAMVQVLLNLLSNAVKFTPAGGAVTVATEFGAGGGLGLIVTDTGCGIRADEIEKAMQPFSQASNQDRARENGYGLGLYLVKRLVEAHDGTFTLESEGGEGVRATAWFPASRLVETAAA